MNTEKEWERLYHLAVLEPDWSKMEDRIRAAETGIQQRLHELSLDHDGTLEENLEIMAAMQKLAVLRGEVSRWHELKQSGSGTRTVR